MKNTYHLIAIATAILLAGNAHAGIVTVPSTFTSGTPAKASEVNANFSAVKTAVDDNDARITANTADISANTADIATNAAAISANTTAISNNAAAIAKVGLHGVTVISPPACQTLASVTTTYQKLGDMGTFNKISDTSTVEIQFNGRLAVVTSMVGTGVRFELRVDNVATTNGRARSLVKAAEVGVDGVQSSITGIFTNLMAGTHTVSLWAVGANGDATNAMWDPGCWSSDHVVVKEME
jgi:hypothetical protein